MSNDNISILSEEDERYNTLVEVARKIDWKRKLTSRKLWVAVSSFVVLLLIACGVNRSSAESVAAIIMAGASVIAYIIGEGLTDAAHVGDVIEEYVPEEEE